MGCFSSLHHLANTVWGRMLALYELLHTTQDLLGLNNTDTDNQGATTTSLSGQGIVKKSLKSHQCQSLCSPPGASEDKS